MKRRKNMVSFYKTFLFFYFLFIMNLASADDLLMPKKFYGNWQLEKVSVNYLFKITKSCEFNQDVNLEIRENKIIFNHLLTGKNVEENIKKYKIEIFDKIKNHYFYKKNGIRVYNPKENFYFLNLNAYNEKTSPYWRDVIRFNILSDRKIVLWEDTCLWQFKKVE